MSRRHPQRFAVPPRDPRSRRVLSAIAKSRRGYLLELECGHRQQRRLLLAPAAVICTDCSSAGGLGGRAFQGREEPATAEVTGELLYQELCSAAAKAGVSLSAFVRPLFPAGSWKLEQLRIAQRPTKRTIERVRALIAGDLPAQQPQPSVPPSTYFRYTRVELEALGVPPSGRSQNEGRLLDAARAARDRVELARKLTEQAHLSRRPGQTIADRVRELRGEVCG